MRKKLFNNRLIMTAEQNEEFERSNICWICEKLIDIVIIRLEIMIILKKVIIIEVQPIGVVILI